MGGSVQLKARVHAMQSTRHAHTAGIEVHFSSLLEMQCRSCGTAVKLIFFRQIRKVNSAVHLMGSVRLFAFFCL